MLPYELHQACAKLLAKPPDQVRFECVYDSVVEGVSSKAFHKTCDHLECGTLTIIEEPSGTRIVGGYASVPWQGELHRFVKDQSSFLFQLDRSSCGYDLASYLPVRSCAEVYCGGAHGPVFGRGHI